MSDKRSIAEKTVDTILDYTWGKFERATQRMMDVVDVQPWTHAVLGISLWCPQFFLQWISYRSYSGSIQILFFVPTIEFWIFLPYGMDSICWHLI